MHPPRGPSAIPALGPLSSNVRRRTQARWRDSCHSGFVASHCSARTDAHRQLALAPVREATLATSRLDAQLMPICAAVASTA